MKDIPRLRLFLSVDVVGSTPFKQRDTHPTAEGPSWSPAFCLFYETFADRFEEEWSIACTSLTNHCTGPKPEFWKGLGDELLYHKELTNHCQTASCLHAWRQAVASTRAILLDRVKELDLKATAWVANFPIANSEVHLGPLRDVLDFAGPSLDNGFRLTSHSSPRKLVTSMGLAWMLAKPCSFIREPYNQWIFHYDGGVILKGIRQGRPSPLFWVDVKPDDPRLAKSDEYLVAQTAINAATLVTHCEALVALDPEHYFRPYIDKSHAPDLYFSEPPETHRKLLESRSALSSSCR